MAGITGMADTFDAPNFVGPLFGLTPQDTPYLSMSGGMSGGEAADATMFTWQTYDLRAASQNTRLEGAAAPTAEERIRATVRNVVEIHQETIDISWTKQAATGQYGALASSHPQIEGLTDTSVLNEMDWQTEQMVKQVARDVEYSFINGTFVEPANNSTARQTRGIVEAITTNVIDLGTLATDVTGETADDLIDDVAHPFTDNDQVRFTALVGGSNLTIDRAYYVVSELANSFQLANTKGGTPLALGSNITATSTLIKLAPLTDVAIIDALQLGWENGGFSESEATTIWVNAFNKRQLTTQFITDGNYREQSRNVGGVNVLTIETDFGRLNVALNRHLRTHEVVIASMELVSPVFLPIENKGFLFSVPLSLVGANNQRMLYGEIGHKYGHERFHAKVLNTTADIV